MTLVTSKDMNGATPTADGFTASFADARGAYVTSPLSPLGGQVLQEAAAAATRKEDQLASLAGSTALTYYLSCEFLTPANPVGGSVRFLSWDGGIACIIATNGTIHAETGGGSTLGGNSPVLTANLWYRIEFTVQLNTGAADDQVRLQIFTSGTNTSLFDTGLLTGQTIATVAPGNLLLGPNTTGHTSPWTANYWRLRVNNATGGAPDNTMPAPYLLGGGLVIPRRATRGLTMR